jgi:glutamine synthetase
MQGDPAGEPGTERLPATLGEAAEAFAGSPVMRTAFGEALHDALSAVRRKEWADHGQKSDAEVVELHKFAY